MHGSKWALLLMGVVAKAVTVTWGFRSGSDYPDMTLAPGEQIVFSPGAPHNVNWKKMNEVGASCPCEGGEALGSFTWTVPDDPGTEYCMYCGVSGHCQAGHMKMKVIVSDAATTTAAPTTTTTTTAAPTATTAAPTATTAAPTATTAAPTATTAAPTATTAAPTATTTTATTAAPTAATSSSQCHETAAYILYGLAFTATIAAIILTRALQGKMPHGKAKEHVYLTPSAPPATIVMGIIIPDAQKQKTPPIAAAGPAMGSITPVTPQQKPDPSKGLFPVTGPLPAGENARLLPTLDF